MLPGWLTLFREFSLVGITSFGGYMAMIAQVRRVVVEQKGWIDADAFSEAVTLASTLPGPAAVNVVAWCGYRLKGWAGAWFTVGAVLWPSILMMLVLSGAYSVVLGWDRLEQLLRFMGLAVGALILSAGIKFISPAGNLWPGLGLGWMRWLVMFISVAVLLIWPGYVTMLLMFGGFALFGQVWPLGGSVVSVGGQKELGYASNRGNIGSLVSAVAYVVILILLWMFRQDLFQLVLLFSRVAGTLFGGAYVVVPILKSELVEGLKLISESDLLVGISLGQLTPGPLLICVVFYGVKIAGYWGGLAAAFGMFFPTAWLLVWVSRHAERFNRFRLWGNAMAMIRPCVAGMILYAGGELAARYAVGGSLPEWIFFLGCFAFMHFTKRSPAWMVALAMVMSVLPL